MSVRPLPGEQNMIGMAPNVYVMVGRCRLTQ